MLSRALPAMLALLLAAGIARAQVPPDADQAQAAPAPAADADQPAMNKPYPVFVGTDVHDVPAEDGTVIARLWPDVQVLVLNLVSEGEWVQIRLPDGQTAGYVPADAIPAAFGQATPDLPSTVSGSPIVRDTATLVIGQRNVHLFKLAGTDGPLADQMQQYISASGGTVSCEEQELGYYRCSVGGTDLALVALINGAAMAIEGAPDSYRQQQEQAQHGHRGIWGSAAPPG